VRGGPSQKSCDGSRGRRQDSRAGDRNTPHPNRKHTQGRHSQGTDSRDDYRPWERSWLRNAICSSRTCIVSSPFPSPESGARTDSILTCMHAVIVSRHSRQNQFLVLDHDPNLNPSVRHSTVFWRLQTRPDGSPRVCTTKNVPCGRRVPAMYSRANVSDVRSNGLLYVMLRYLSFTLTMWQNSFTECVHCKRAAKSCFTGPEHPLVWSGLLRP
jgi:hypothetical protein